MYSMALPANTGFLETFFILGTFGKLLHVSTHPGSSGHTGASKVPPNKQVVSISDLESSFGTLASSVHRNVKVSSTGISPSSEVTNKPLTGVTALISSSKQGIGAHRALVNWNKPES